MESYTLITGASEGVGLEFARIYASKGQNLILVSRSYEKLCNVNEELKKYDIKIKLLSLDLSVENSCEKVKAFVDKENIFVDRLINNAGVGSFGEFHNHYNEMIDEIIALNVKTVTKLTHLFLNRMIGNESGEILNVASTAAFCAGPRMSIYYATKAYVLSLTEGLHEEYKDKNIKISCLCPGAISTGFQEKAGIRKKEGSEKLLMDASEVAQIGVKGLKSGEAIIVPGFKNKTLVCLNKFLSRSMTRKIILKMNKE